MLLHDTLRFRLNDMELSPTATISLYGQDFIVKSVDNNLVWDFSGEDYTFTTIGEIIFRSVGTNNFSVTWLGYPDLMFKIDYGINSSSSSSSDDLPDIYFSTWPSTIDSYYSYAPDDWTMTKNLMVEMRDLGVTHVGIFCQNYQNLSGEYPLRLADLQAKLAELRALDFKFTILALSGYLESTFYKYSFGSGVGAIAFKPGETVISGVKTAIVRATVDGGVTGTITLTNSTMTNGDTITGSISGKTANVTYVSTSSLQSLDGGVHATNGLDLRFYDTPFFELNAGAPGCRNDIKGFALDPSYSGTIWSDYLDKITVSLNAMGFTDDDFWYNDIEWWAKASAYVGYCGYTTPVPMIGNSIRCGENPTPNPTHDLLIAYQNYEYHWLQRALDITNTVHAHSPGSRVLHYSETLPEVYADYSNNCYWLPGSGDVAIPTFFLLNDIGLLAGRIAEADDWDGCFVSISFTYSNGSTKIFDSPDNSYTAGVMLKQAGFIGFYEYPGYDYLYWSNVYNGLKTRWPDYNDFIIYYKAHLVAFLDGYNSG